MQFKNNSNGYSVIRNKLLKRIIPTMLIALAVGLLIPAINSNFKIDFRIYFFVIPICLIAGGFGLSKGLKRQKAIFDSYILTIQDNVISREQNETGTISILFSNVSEIVKNPKGEYLIKGSGTDEIIVSSYIENVVELERILNEIKPVVFKSSKAFIEKYSIPLSVLNVFLLMIVMISMNKLLVVFSGVLLFITIIYSFVEIRRNVNIDSKTKKASNWMLLILFIAGFNIVMKFNTKEQNDSNTDHLLEQIKQYTSQIEKNGNDPELYYNRGCDRLEIGDYKLAKEDFAKAIELDQEYVVAYNNKANVENRLEEYDEAILDCNRAIELDSTSEKAYFNRGNAMKHKEEYQQAMNDYNTAISIDSNFSYAYANRAVLKYIMEDAEGACIDWEKAKELGYQGNSHHLNDKCN